MLRKICFVTAAMLLLVGVVSAEAQQWSPPTREMPAMPRMGEVSGVAQGSAWFSGVGRVIGADPSSLRAVGEARRGSNETQVVRFNNGPIPAVVWQDRNGDGRADMIEIYRGATLAIQVIDADYDGTANVVRRYDASGTLEREDRL